MIRLSARNRLILFPLAMVALMLMLVSPVTPTIQAQSGCPDGSTLIEYGESITGSIEKGAPAVLYCVEVAVGDELVVEMKATSGNLDSFLAITTVDAEEVLATNDDVESGVSDSRIEYEATESGEILVMATRFEFADGTTTGDFDLTLDCENCTATSDKGDTGAVENNCPDIFDVLEYNETVTGEVTDEAYFIFFCFNGREGDEITLDVRATSGDLDTRLIIADIEVTETLAENDDRETGNTDSLLEYTVEADGPYLIAVGRFQGEEGSTTGEFELAIEGPTTVVAGDPGDCETPPLSDLVTGTWIIESDDIVLEMQFNCKGQVSVSINGDIDTFDYAFDGLTIVVGNDNLVFENVVVVEGLMMATFGEDENLLLFLNSEFESEEEESSK